MSNIEQDTLTGEKPSFPLWAKGGIDGKLVYFLSEREGICVGNDWDIPDPRGHGRVVDNYISCFDAMWEIIPKGTEIKITA